jgi:metal-dependent amidase/aminoacylase/carboxypeptidase family protein
VVGIVHGRDGGACGRAIGLRADMDALPMQEFNTFAHASQHPGKMHACGHDGHTAMLLAAAQHLAQHRDFRRHGVPDLPARRRRRRRRARDDQGRPVRAFPMDAVFGMHNWPGMPVGTFAVSPGPVMASSNEFKITIRGKGGHAACRTTASTRCRWPARWCRPSRPSSAATRSRSTPGVISVTMIHTGEATNVVPDFCEMQGTVRTFTLEVLDLIEQRMREIAEHTCAAFGAQCEFAFSATTRPPSTTRPKPPLRARSWRASSG